MKILAHKKTDHEKPAEAKPAEPINKLTVKIADLDFEILRDAGSLNYSLSYENGARSAISDINTILLWEILKALRKT